MVFKSVRNSQHEIIDFEWTFVNAQAGILVDRNPEQLVGKKLLKEMPGNRELGLFDQYLKVVETGESSIFDIQYHDRLVDSWFHVQAVKLDDGFVVTFLDISKLKHFENELVRKEKLLSEAQDLANLGSWSWDLANNTVNWSNKVYDIFETSREGFTPSYTFLLEQVIDEDQPFVEKTISEAINNGLPYEITFRIKPNHAIKHLEARAVPKLNEENEIQEYLGIIKDVTAEKAQQQALVKSQKKAKQMEKVASSERLARSIAHEIRNPLTNITLATEQLKAQNDPEDSELFLDLISRNCNRIEGLIQQLMDSAKQAEMQMGNYNINHILDDALSLALDRIKLREIEVAKDYQQDMCELSLDQEKLKVAILNIIINAVEAMKDHGLLYISTRLTDEECIVEITDNGVGIPQDRLNQLFDPFYTNKKKGLGLGLTTTLNILNSHNANIEVDSEPGKGTTFILSFQRA